MMTTPVVTPATSRPLRGLARAAYMFSLLGSLGGGAVGVLGFLAANGAPQEAAAAAFGVLCAVAPYVVARSLDELDR